MKRLIRGHECVNHGTEVRFNEKCVTVFSASSYNKEMGNKSGILKVIKNGDKIETVTFCPIAPLNRSNANFFQSATVFRKVVIQASSKTVLHNDNKQAPLGKLQSDQLFKSNNDQSLNETVQMNLSQGSLVKNPNGCPIVTLNRKQKVLTNNLRKLNSSFQFNTGIRNSRRQSSSNCLTQMQKKISQIQQKQDFQSDNQAEFEVEKMELEQNERETPLTPQKMLPKLMLKNEQ